MISSSKLQFYPERLVSNNPSPVTAEIFLTNYCNNHCSYCRYSNNTGNYITFENFVKYTEVLLNMGVKGIILTGGGEPTINPDFDKITEYLEKNNISYGINTNFNIYKDFNPVFLKVSIDATNATEYKEMRGVDKFKIVQDNIVRFKKNHPNTTVGVQSLILHKDQVSPFYQAHSYLPVDYLVYRPLETKEHYYTEYDLVGINQSIDNIITMDKRVQKNYKWGMIDKRFNKCYANWSVITINCFGQVIYCCHRPDAIVGHILDSDIIEKKRNYKINMSECEVPCRLSGPNDYILHNQDLAFI